VVHQGGGFDDPGIAGMSLRVVPALGAIDCALLLRFADEDEAVAMRVFGSQLGSDLILASPLFEADEGNFMLLGEALDGLHEGAGHRFHRGRGKDLGLPLVADKVERALQDLEAAYDHVQIHAVDGFHLQSYVPTQDFGHGLW